MRPADMEDALNPRIVGTDTLYRLEMG